MAAEVSESEALFLEDARRTIARLAESVRSFGQRSYLDFGSAWGDQFAPVYDAWRELYDRGQFSLAPGSEARAEFTTEMNDLNVALGKAQNDEEGWLGAMARYASNPLAFQWRVAQSIGAGAVEGTRAYAREGLGGAAQWFKDVLSSPVTWVVGGGLLLLAGRRR